MGNKLRHEGDEVRIKVIWPDGVAGPKVPNGIPAFQNLQENYMSSLDWDF